MVENMLARDAEEGIGAFLEKREPMVGLIRQGRLAYDIRRLTRTALTPSIVPLKQVGLQHEPRQLSRRPTSAASSTA